MPSATSSESAPVGTTAISSSGPPAPRRMTEPLPNCRSIVEMASSRACFRSVFTSAMRALLMGSPGSWSLDDWRHSRSPNRQRQCPIWDTLLGAGGSVLGRADLRSEEHTSELQSLAYLVCRLLLEKKKKKLT